MDRAMSFEGMPVPTAALERADLFRRARPGELQSVGGADALSLVRGRGGDLPRGRAGREHVRDRRRASCTCSLRWPSMPEVRTRSIFDEGRLVGKLRPRRRGRDRLADDRRAALGHRDGGRRHGPARARAARTSARWSAASRGCSRTSRASSRAGSPRPPRGQARGRDAGRGRRAGRRPLAMERGVPEMLEPRPPRPARGSVASLDAHELARRRARPARRAAARARDGRGRRAGWTQGELPQLLQQVDRTRGAGRRRRRRPSGWPRCRASTRCAGSRRGRPGRRAWRGALATAGGLRRDSVSSGCSRRSTDAARRRRRRLARPPPGAHEARPGPRCRRREGLRARRRAPGARGGRLRGRLRQRQQHRRDRRHLDRPRARTRRRSRRRCARPSRPRPWRRRSRSRCRASRAATTRWCSCCSEITAGRSFERLRDPAGDHDRRPDRPQPGAAAGGAAAGRRCSPRRRSPACSRRTSATATGWWTAWPSIRSRPRAVIEDGADVTVVGQPDPARDAAGVARPGAAARRRNPRRRGSRMLDTLLEVMDLSQLDTSERGAALADVADHPALRARELARLPSCRPFPGRRPGGDGGAAAGAPLAGRDRSSQESPTRGGGSEWRSTFTFEDVKRILVDRVGLPEENVVDDPECDLREHGARLAGVRRDPARDPAGVRLHDPRRGRGQARDRRRRASTTSTSVWQSRSRAWPRTPTTRS